MQRFMTPVEAAAVLRVSIRTIYDWLADGRLQASKPGRHWLISEQNIQDCLDGKTLPKASSAGNDGERATPGPAPKSSPALPELVVVERVLPSTAALLGVVPGSSPSPLANRKTRRKH
jgi:excisionase family DNA binding protein